MNRTNFERFLESDEPQVFGSDWEGNEIYEGDEYVETELGLVRMEDIPRFVKETQKVMVAGE
ncbi:hypothetical protein [Trichococcus flocculiformis]|uniref:hypothetical protein n=1 Tax=Trichococcus flocculiformis TaxID=82803 RepID=UPI003DA222EB